MDNFILNFLIFNLSISGIILFLLIVKKIFKKHLSSKAQYYLWFPLLGILLVPFIPLNYFYFNWTLSFDTNIKLSSIVYNSSHFSSNWKNDFTTSVSRHYSPSIGHLLFSLWILGILIITLFLVKSFFHLYILKSSSLPLQNEIVFKLYQNCLKEMKISKAIPIYSNAFLKSPMIVGSFKPCIYLPIHLIIECSESELRYMLLHELQHYKHKDNYLVYYINFIKIIYWFNPLIWYVIQAINTDKEIACDFSVLETLDENEIFDYGNTLINFAEKINLFPFSSQLGSTKSLLTKRIIHISAYQNLTTSKKLKDLLIFLITTIFLFSCIPFIYTSAKTINHYTLKSKNISIINLSNYFEKYNGCFVLYDSKNNYWKIYNMDNASLRISPDSTYKIYDALLGLEENIITSSNSFIKWDNTTYPFESWNKNHSLSSAMEFSVNWYFQTLDKHMEKNKISNYLRQIQYGNQNITGSLTSYWLESSLKISPIEQVELLYKLQTNKLNFSSKNINAVKSSICLSSSNKGILYGKTGTGRVNHQDINGWFVGFIESSNTNYFFATNIQANTDSTGSHAAKITLSILSNLGIWQ